MALKKETFLVTDSQSKGGIVVSPPHKCHHWCCVFVFMCVCVEILMDILQGNLPKLSNCFAFLCLPPLYKQV